MTRTLRIGTRGSALALVQARWVAARLAEAGVDTELAIIRTEGDDRPADTAWGEGAFVTAIDAALVGGRVDVAVHSAKDVPTGEDPRLVIAAYPRREDPRDALVARVRGTTLAALPAGARVGTDSPRRSAFLRAVRPDLQLHPLHGNVDTRLAKLDAGESDALVLAVAGLTRLGRADRIDEILPAELAAPAPGQGSLAVQVRADDVAAVEAVGRLDDPATRVAVETERALLNGTGGGCRSPIGAYARVEGDQLVLLAGAARELPVDRDAAGRFAPIAWVSGRAPVVEGEALARTLADRIVAARTRPRALVTRPADQAAGLAAALAGLGVEPVVVPTIEIVPAGPGGPLDEAVAPGTPTPPAWIVVTSANGARAAAGALRRTGSDPASVRWAAVGEATAAALASVGITVAFTPAHASGAAIAADLPAAPGERILLARADIADAALPEALRARGLDVTEAVAYSTREGPEASRDLLAAALASGPIDVVVLSSGSTARGLLTLAPESRHADLLDTLVVAIGASTAADAQAAGFRRVVAAGMQRADGLALAVAAALGLPVVAPTPPTATSTPLAPPVSAPAHGDLP